MSQQTIPKLGQLITSEAYRDAIHIAIAPVEATEDLEAGWPIEVQDGKASFNNIEPIGIVDPFLKVLIKKGDRFFIFLYPNTITSLRHVWTHPDFKAKIPGI